MTRNSGQQCKTGRDSVPQYGCRPQLPTLLVLLRLMFLHGSQGSSAVFPDWLILAFSFPLRHSRNKFISPIRKTSERLSSPRQIHPHSSSTRLELFILFIAQESKTNPPHWQSWEAAVGLNGIWVTVLCLPFTKPWLKLLFIFDPQLAFRPMHCIVLEHWTEYCPICHFLPFF